MSHNPNNPIQISRRDVLGIGLAGAAAVILGGCGQGTPPTKESEEVEGIFMPQRQELVSGPVALNPADLTSTPLYGPDTSRVQVDGETLTGLLDARRMIAEGFSYHLAKATRGDGSYGVHHDPLFEFSRREAADAGLLLGAYHFLEHGNATVQCDKYFDRLEATGGIDGLLHIIDVESYPNEAGVRENSTYDDVLEYVDRYKQITSGASRLIIYSASWFWGDVDEYGELGNPPAPEGTELWWCRLIRGQNANPVVTKDQLDPLVSRPSDADDPWRTEQLGTWQYPAFRQLTFNGLMQQFDGSPRRTGEQYEGTMLKVADMNVSFYPLDKLKAIGGIAE